MRVLFTSNPLIGHVNTMLPLVRATIRGGHDVAFATGAALAPYLARRGVRTWRVGPDTAPRGSSVDWLEHFLSSGAQRTRSILERSASWQPDVVVHDETELAGALAALATGAQHVVHGLGVPPPAALWHVLAPALEQLIAREGVAGRADEVREARYLTVCPPSLQPPPSDQIWADARPIRHSPGSPAPGEEERGPALEDLPYERTVHLTLGTVFNDRADLVRTAINGLRQLPVNVVVTVGPYGCPVVVDGEHAHIVVERYVPHSLLLPRCAAVVSHGGAGVMLGALAHGVPQLVLPQGADQHLNAAALARSGAGLSIEPGEVTAARVARAVDQLLHDPSFARASAVVQTEMAAMPEPSDALLGLIPCSA